MSLNPTGPVPAGWREGPLGLLRLRRSQPGHAWLEATVHSPSEPYGSSTPPVTGLRPPQAPASGPPATRVGIVVRGVSPLGSPILGLYGPGGKRVVGDEEFLDVGFLDRRDVGNLDHVEMKVFCK